MEKITVADAVKESLNTVAIKCLDKYGVKNSLEYMEETFNLTLDFEKKKLKTMGEDEVIGNIGLGYLQDGVSPVQMAGYYQSFANGGFYTAPTAILKICDADGQVIYRADDEMDRVVSPEAAYVMNLMLQEVVKDGTGTAAAIEGLNIGGKTGTGPEGNWFVGFTPEYSCAVWHGTGTDSNYAAQIFAAIAGGWKHDTEKAFPESGTVKEDIYCSESGKKFSSDCTSFDKGYYLSVKCPDNCDIH
jgi:penicillin-binding protein 1A